MTAVRRAARSTARPSRKRLLSTIFVVALCAAPVPGDIGSCGQPIQRLDARRFFGAKKLVDCRRCSECDVPSSACSEACDGDTEIPESFPKGCVPLVHDGEVCLRALLYASCGDYSNYMDDASPAVPTECNFCPKGGQ